LCDLWYNTNKNTINKDNFDDIVLWKNYKLRHVIEDNWGVGGIHEFVASDGFIRHF
jgi:hypothetical protein